MLEKMTFINHEGETIESIKDQVYVNYNDLRDYRWEYETQSDRIIKFKKEVVEKTIPVIIFSDSEEQAVEMRNRLFSLSEKDILKRKPGKIVIDGYYLSGYIIESKKSNYLLNKRYMQLELIFATDRNVWRRETTYQFLPENITPDMGMQNPVVTGEIYTGETIENQATLKEFRFDFLRRSDRKIRYPQFDLPFEFTKTYGKRVINNTEAFSESDFVLTIYGFVDTPSILIAGHPYVINAMIYEGERVVIDSAAGTVKKIGRLGEETNLYNSRGKEYSVFQKIPPGVQTVSWSGGFGFDLLLYDERSEPKWSL